MGTYFKGKTTRYHTEVTTTKNEQIVIWITALLLFVCILLSLFIFESVWMTVLFDFIVFLIVFSIWIFILFRPNHKEEVEQNTTISK